MKDMLWAIFASKNVTWHENNELEAFLKSPHMAKEYQTYNVL